MKYKVFKDVSDEDAVFWRPKVTAWYLPTWISLNTKSGYPWSRSESEAWEACKTHALGGNNSRGSGEVLEFFLFSLLIAMFFFGLLQLTGGLEWLKSLNF